MPVDLKRLVPEHFLASQRFVELLEALNEWFSENWEKIEQLRYAYDPDKGDTQLFRNAVAKLGWGDVSDVASSDYLPDILRTSFQGWKIAGSLRFWELVSSVLRISFTYQDQSTLVLSYSSGEKGWSNAKRFQDADYYRDGVFVTHLTPTDLSLFEYIRDWFTAGCLLYYIIQWGVTGSVSYAQEADWQLAKALKLLSTGYAQVEIEPSRKWYDPGRDEARGDVGRRVPNLVLRTDSMVVM